jgi:hypothetical protein
MGSTSDLARKLGLKPGLRVGFIAAPPETAAAIRSQAPDGVIFAEDLEGLHFDVILFWPTRLVDLAQRFAELQRHIRPDGAVWAVIPKKKYAPARGVDFSWAEMQAAGLQTDLVDNKEASISEQDYGTRFVIRKEHRKKYARSEG